MSFYYDDGELQEAFETLIDKGFTPEQYQRVWEQYHRCGEIYDDAFRFIVRGEGEEADDDE